MCVCVCVCLYVCASVRTYRALRPFRRLGRVCAAAIPRESFDVGGILLDCWHNVFCRHGMDHAGFLRLEVRVYTSIRNRVRVRVRVKPLGLGYESIRAFVIRAFVDAVWSL